MNILGFVRLSVLLFKRNSYIIILIYIATLLCFLLCLYSMTDSTKTFVDISTNRKVDPKLADKTIIIIGRGRNSETLIVTQVMHFLKIMDR